MKDKQAETDRREQKRQIIAPAQKWKSIWLSPQLLTWFIECNGGSVVERAEFRRAYEHFQRAEYFLHQPSSAKQYDLADCVANLRKCFTSRARLIEKLYRLRSNLETTAKRHYLDLLGDIGVVRPSLLQALLAARNAIEYSDADPPKRSRCVELVDAVWYFLRATDPFVAVVHESLHITPPEENPDTATYGLSVDLKYEPTFGGTFWGWLPESFVSTTASARYLPVKAKEYERKDERLSRGRVVQVRRGPNDIFISGKFVDLTVEHKRSLISAALTTI